VDRGTPDRRDRVRHERDGTRYASAVIPMMERYVIIAELLARRG